MISTHMEVDMELPALDKITLGELRRMRSKKVEELKAAHPSIEHLRVTLVFYCDLEQRIRAEDLPNFTYHTRSNRPYSRLEHGRCESFVFKYKHIENGEVVRG